MNRLLLAALAVALLVGLAGCATIFGGISDETLDEEAEYDDLKAENVTVAIDVEGSEFRAVYDLNDTDSLELYRSGYYRERALDIRAVHYWYPNGTKVTGSELTVDQGRSSTDVVVPDGNGTLAFTGDAGSRTFTLPAYVDGSYVLYLPEGHRSTHLLFGRVSPGSYEREVADDRERISWEHVDGTVRVQHYAQRDVPLFYGLVSLAVIIGGTIMGIKYRQVQRLRRRREELGLDVDLEDDSDRKPPPGFD